MQYVGGRIVVYCQASAMSASMWRGVLVQVNPQVLPQSNFLLGGLGSRTLMFPQLSHVGQVEHLDDELAVILSATMQVNPQNKNKKTKSRVHTTHTHCLDIQRGTPLLYTHMILISKAARVTAVVAHAL